MNKLVELFDKHKCDKGNLRHRYDRVYEPALQHLRDQEFNMLEIGIYKGSSVEAWREYFPKANFYGIDIFVRVEPENIPALNRDRVHWCKCDSLVGPNEAFLEMVGDIQFDVIIDDGLHTHDAQRKTFENFIPFLKQDGVYFIEDVWAFDHMSLQEKNHHWMKQHPDDYSEEQYSELMSSLLHNKITYHDLREGYHTDTFILEVHK